MLEAGGIEHILVLISFEKYVQMGNAIIITGLTIYTSKESLYRETGWEKLSIRREQRKLDLF
jgi:hypothetical protein